MITLLWDAHDLTRLRLCAASDCGDEALTGSAVCNRHERHRLAGKHIRLHPIATQPEPVLNCLRCHAWLPDAAFPSVTRQPGTGGRIPDRRGRGVRCVKCLTTLHVHAFNERHES